MAERTVSVFQQQLKPIKIIKWKVRSGTVVSIGSPLLIYDFADVSKEEQRKWKSSQAGTVHQILAQEGQVVQPGDILLELQACSHPTIMNDMCAECGADLQKNDDISIASVPMIHAIPDLKVSEELAQKLGKADNDRLLKERKLVLLVDLDQTLIHTTNDNIPANIKDVYHFQLHGVNSPWYHTRLRPGTHQFLQNILDYYELHICTFGSRNYAHTIAMFLDADQNIFSNRILSRDECFDPTSKKANLKALFPCGDNMVCIIDDREDVWSHATNLIHVKPYHFFQHTGDINAPPGLDKHENDKLDKGVDLTKISNKPDVADNTNVTENKKEEVDKKNVKTDTVEATCTKNDEESKNVIKPNEDHKIVKNSSEDTSESSKPSEDTETSTQNETTKNKEASDNKGDESTKEPSNPEQTQPEVKVEKKNETAELNKETQSTTEEEQKNEPKQRTASRTLMDIDDPDDYLIYLEEILKHIHDAFYKAYDKLEAGEVPDLKTVIPLVRGNVLKGCNLVFSGLVPTHVKLEQSKAYQVARGLGAVVTQDIGDDSTHLVAVRPGTAKVNSGRRKKKLKIVTPDWLWCCAERWEHVDERIFPLNSKGSKNRHPPPHCSSPEHVTNYPEHGMPETRKRTPSGKFMDTINPLMSFSSDDIADMDKEWIKIVKEDKFNKKYLWKRTTTNDYEANTKKLKTIAEQNNRIDDDTMEDKETDPGQSANAIQSDSESHSEIEDFQANGIRNHTTESHCSLQTNSIEPNGAALNVNNNINWNSYLAEEARKEARMLTDKYPFKDTCHALKPPLMNKEVYKCLRPHQRKNDHILTTFQTMLGSSVTALSSVIIDMKTNRDGINLDKIVSTLDDSIRLQCSVYRGISRHRRYPAKYYANKNVREFLKSRPVDKYLFGKELGKLIEMKKGVNKVVLKLKRDLEETSTVDVEAGPSNTNVYSGT